MAKKKEVYKVKPLNENKKNIISALIEEYDIETADDIQEALKDLLGGTIKSMMDLRWMSISDTRITSEVIMIIIVMEQKEKQFAATMENFRSTFLRTGKAALNLK